jgi:hypothetical protein
MEKHVFEVGDFASNIESGWVGIIDRFEGEGLDRMAVMRGVDYLCQMVAGLTLEEALCDNDIEWHSPADLVFIRRGVQGRTLELKKIDVHTLELRKLNVGVVDDTISTLPVVFSGSAQACVNHAAREGYKWKAKKGMLYGGYFVNHDGAVLFPT